MGSELISIIVPVYNAEKYLRACLDSLRQQQYSAIEVWMVDDGSTDGSGAICDEYEAADSRFHAVHQQNARSSISRTVDGILTLLRLWHARKPAALIFRTGSPSMYAGITRSPS